MRFVKQAAPNPIVKITSFAYTCTTTQYERICRECFWDYSMSPEDIRNIIEQGSYTEKKKLFFKIVFNSTNRLADSKLFSESDLRQLLQEPLPEHKSKYMERRIGILKYLLLNDTTVTTGLEWKKL